MKLKKFNESTESELFDFTNWLLKNCYILNHTKWEYKGDHYSNEEIYDAYKLSLKQEEEYLKYKK